MKKVAILIPYLSGYGGTEVVIHNLLKEYFKSKSNFQISVYSLGGFKKNNYLRFHNVHILKFPNNSVFRKFLYIFFLPILICYLLFKIKPNIIISTTPVIWSISQIISKLFHMYISVIAWYQYSYNAKPVNSFFLKHADYFFTISSDGKQILIQQGVLPSQIFVIYDPIIPSAKTIENSKNHNQLIYVGRIEYAGQKNIKELFKALSLIKNKRWTLKIYGTGPDINKLRMLSKHLNIFNNIIWMGFIHNIWEHVDVADALILTSNYEGFSMVLAEAISRGLYVISSNCSDGPSEIINKYNGNIYRLGNIKQLSLLINNVISGNKVCNKVKMKRSISKFYINNYTRRFFSDLTNILKSGVK